MTVEPRAGGGRLGDLQLTIRGWFDRPTDQWWAPIVLVGILAHGYPLARLIVRLGPATRPPLRDSIIFEYIGWYITQGGRLYIDAWEIKPPLAFELPAVLTILAGGNIVVAHWLSVFVTVIAAVGGAVLVGAIVLELTGDRTAATLGGVALYTLPVYGWRTAFGFKVKYLVVAVGLLAIWLALRDRRLAAGVAAGAAVGVWQLAAIFPVLALGLSAQRGGFPGLRRCLGGLGASLAIILLPVVVWGAVPAMLVETVFTPLLVSEGGTILGRLERATRLFGPLVPLVILGGVGLAAALRESLRDGGWWAPVLGAWFAMQLLVLDLDFFPDLIPLYAVVAIGLGLLVGTDRIDPAPLGAVLMALLLTAVLTHGAFTAGPGLRGPNPVQAPADDIELDPPYSPAEERALFWGTHRPDTCRIFFGPTQAGLIRATGGTRTQATCGQFDPAWGALLDRFGLGG